MRSPMGWGSLTARVYPAPPRCPKRPDVRVKWDASTHLAVAELPSLGALVTDPNQTRTPTKRALSRLTDVAVNNDDKRNLYEASGRSRLVDQDDHLGWPGDAVD